MAAKLVTGIAKVTQKILKASRVKVARGLGKVSNAFGRAASRAKGMLGKMAVVGAASSVLGNKKSGDQAQGEITSVGDSAEAGEGEASSSADPLIGIPEIEIDGLLTDTAERVDLTVTEPLIADVAINPTPIVEGYFDGDASTVTTEAVMPAGTEIKGISNSVGALAAQIKALQALSDSIDTATDQNEKTKRDNERRRDEEDVEKKSKPGVMYEGARSAGQIAGGFIAKWLVPAIAVALAGITSAFADEQSDNESTLDDALDELSFLEGIEEKYAALTVALGTAGLNVSKGFQAVSATLSAKSANFVQKMSAVSSKATTAYQKAATNLGKLSQVVSANPVARAFIAPLRMFAGFFQGVASIVGPALAKVTGAVAKLPKFMIKFFKGFLSKPLKYLVIFEIIDSMIDGLMAFMFNSISEAEFHTRMKKNINDIVGLIGGTWITTIIFTAIGNVIGSFVPIFGNIAGTILGVTMGVLFGEDVYKIIGGNDIVDAMYDYFFLGKKTTMKELGNKILESGKQELQNVIDQYTEFFKSTFDYVTGEDKVASVEAIEEKYGAGATLSDIAGAQLDSYGTDEDALLYVADNIDSIEQLQQVDEKLKAERGMTLNELARSELNDSEYENFVNVLNASIDAGPPEEKPIDTAEQGDGVDRTYASDPYTAQEGEYLTQEQMADLSSGVDTSNLNPEAVETVRNIQSVFHGEEQPIERVRNLYESAISVANDGNYEEVKQVYTDMTGRSLQSDMSDVIGTEEAKIVDSIMSAEPEEVAEIVAEAGLTQFLEQALPDVSSDIKEKAGQVIPVIMNMAKGEKTNINPSGSQARSQFESATPTFNTSDAFVTFNYQT